LELELLQFAFQSVIYTIASSRSMSTTISDQRSTTARQIQTSLREIAWGRRAAEFAPPQRQIIDPAAPRRATNVTCEQAPMAKQPSGRPDRKTIF
jgi:hypothetical protein